MPGLRVQGLSKRFGQVQALSDMSLSVAPGEIYGFVGSNGAGKSTTMRITLGVLSADEGEVFVDDKPIDDDLRRRIGYMPEERGLYDKEKIADQLSFIGRLYGMDSKAAASSASELLERLGLGDRKDDKLEALSLGNQQRVQLAASLIHDPDILVLDEPFSGLDPVAVSVMSEMLEEKAAQGAAVLFSSHQLDLVQRLCDRVGIVHKGRMKAEGTVHELRTAGPVVYEVDSAEPVDRWLPQGAQVLGTEGSSVFIGVDQDSPLDDQAILRAALAAGPVHSFGRKVPDLTELFNEVVTHE